MPYKPRFKTQECRHLTLFKGVCETCDELIEYEMPMEEEESNTNDETI